MFLENIHTLKADAWAGPIKIAVGFVASTMRAVGRRKAGTLRPHRREGTVDVIKTVKMISGAQTTLGRVLSSRIQHKAGRSMF